jgi:hypothetical protein
VLEKFSLAMHVFDRASKYVDEHAHLRDEVAWQQSRSIATLRESDFLREYAWVIFCSGFRESIVRRWFSYLSLCYCDWESSWEILQCKEQCVASALRAINHPRKHEAIIHVAELIHQDGFGQFKEALEHHSASALRSLPFIGPITAQHLAKNCGVMTAKPDRHLVRLSHSLGFEDAHSLCASISQMSGCSVNVVDLILWRFIADGQSKLTSAIPA